jgi:methylglyoxal synthase
VARRLALIAHDNKKVDFVAWATFNRETLSQFDLIATRHTARFPHPSISGDAKAAA